jgi:carboxyl-terminal processing protease
MTQQAPKTSTGPFGKAPIWGVVVLVVVVAGLLVDTTRADNDNFYSDISRFDDVALKIHQNYVVEVNSKDLVDKAVEGMLGILDPHTNYFEEKQFRELRIHTEGKFGGLGIQIAIRDKVLTVMTPISGTPAARAGIQSGDQILEIDGKPTRGIQLDAAVGKLRGEPGTQVSILIGRTGEDHPTTYTITREIIKINAVPFAGVLQNGIGYVRLTTFSEDAGTELEKAIKGLLKKDIKSLIFDLRSNPGGLLPEAKEVASKFLPRKSLVVYTRGRSAGQNKDFEVELTPVVGSTIPIVVLVNAASASASEIVAGAIQDWDRGVVLGDTTFGKGSVQSIIQLDRTHHIKMTTAYYYTPSGRCINRPENQPRGVDQEDADGGDGEDSVAAAHTKAAADSAKNVRDTTTYHTKGGRVVHGGGGIVPDTIVQLPYYDQLTASLLTKDLFFKFATSVYPKLQKRKTRIDTSLVVDDKLLKEFRDFLTAEKFDFKTRVDVALDDFKNRAGLSDTTKDTVKSARPDRVELSKEETEVLQQAIEKIDVVLKQQDDREFAKRDAELRKHIREALLVRGLGSDNEVVYRLRLQDDVQVKAAIDLLAKKDAYQALLAP